MTPTDNDPGSSKSADAQSAIDWLVRESKRYKSTGNFVTFLVSQIRASSPPAHELEFTVGALRAAVGVYLQDRTSEAPGNRCRFCGKSSKDVRTLLVSGESTICDECVVTSLETISRQPGQFHLRIAFFIFRAVASLGHLLSVGTGRKQKGSG